jgi:hypothetical protein
MKKKTFCIASPADRPCLELVARVIEVSTGYIVVKYIAEKWKNFHKMSIRYPQDVTYIEDFGVDLTFDYEEGTFTAKKVSESTAVNTDGSIREWNDDFNKMEKLAV